MKQFKVTPAEYDVIRTDLNRAKKYLDLLEKEKADGASVASIREALSLAAVVAYIRPFTPCNRKDGSGKRKRWIPEGLVADLPPDFQRLHTKLQEDRDRTWAHTDENALGANLIRALKKTIIPTFKNLIKQVMDRLEV
ncbi:MAG: hypothetical protein WAP47_12000 [Candidatus Rokuibacteriota bacterium]